MRRLVLALLLSCTGLVQTASREVPLSPGSILTIDDHGTPRFFTVGDTRPRPLGRVVHIEPPALASSLDQGPFSMSNDERSAEQWALRKVGAPQAWKRSTGAKVVVAVLDTGVDAGHEDLNRVLPGIDLVDPGTPPDDPNGHGTHVAGIIAAVKDNSIGVSGLAPEAEILPVRVLDEQGYGDHSTIATGVVWATDHNADIINLSLGGDDDSNALRTAVSYAISHGVLVVAAAGNSKMEGNAPSHPADYEGVIAVAAAGPDNRAAIFSTTGSYVDIAAPGFAILSTTPSGYDYLSGTSQAAPYVSAALALLLSTGASPAGAVHALLSSAAPTNQPSEETGAGYLDASALLGGPRTTGPSFTLPDFGTLPPIKAPSQDPSTPGTLPVLPTQPGPPPTNQVHVQPLGKTLVSVPNTPFGSRVEVRVSSFDEPIALRTPTNDIVSLAKMLDHSFKASFSALTPGSVEVLDKQGRTLAATTLNVSPTARVVRMERSGKYSTVELSVSPVSPVLVIAEAYDNSYRPVAMAVATHGVATLVLPQGSYRLVLEAYNYAQGFSAPFVIRR